MTSNAALDWDPHGAVHFRRTWTIRFSDCDPAGIVFFPNYLVLFNGLVEDWFTHGLGIHYARMLGVRRTGLPTVRLEVDFRAISRMGDEVDFLIVVEAIGHHSITLKLFAVADAEVRVAARQVLVFTSLDTHRAIAIPEDVKAALERCVRAVAGT